MRTVAYISTAYPPSVGGAQFLCHRLLRELAPHQRQWVVTQWDSQRSDWLLGSTLLSPWRPADYSIDGIEVRRLRFSALDRLRMLPAVPPFYFAPAACSPRLTRVFQSRLARLLDGAEMIHGFRIGRENLLMAALAEARRRGIPFVLTPTHHPRWVGRRYRVYHYLYRQADRLICLSEAEREQLVALGADARRTRVIGAGPILSERFDAAAFRRRHGLDGCPVALFVGQKYAYKGLDLLLAAAPSVWRKEPEARFVFIGPRTSYSKRLFARTRDPRILEIGALDVEAKTSAIAAANLLVLPSRQESFGLVFTEAWAMGKPVIGADTPAAASVISDGEDGLLAPPDPERVAEMIVSILRDDAMARRMGEAGREKVRRHYSWQIIGARTREVYDELLGRSSAPARSELACAR